MISIVDDISDTVSICKIPWDMMWFLDSIMIKTTFETKNPEIRKHADEMLEILEAATEHICQSAEPDPLPFEERIR